MALVFPQAEITGNIGGAGLSSRKPVRVATTVAGTLATAFADGQTVDGIVIATGDRVLLKNQTAQTQNGVYITQVSGAPVRAIDYDDGDAVAGSFVYVQEGATNGSTGWLCTNTSGNDIIGTNNITFRLISGDISGSGVSTDNAIVRWDGTTGTKTQNSAIIIDDGNNMTGLQYLQFSDIATPTNPLAGQGRLYKKTGSAGIWWRPDAAGSEVDLTGVTSVLGTTNQVAVSAATGAVTISTPLTFIAPGSVASTTSVTSGTSITSGTTLTSGTLLIDGTTASIAAAGATQGTATLLSTTYNVVTTVAASTGVRLPIPVAGTNVKVINKGANTLNIYPATGGIIDGAAANSAITLPVGASIELEALSGTQWYTVVPPIIQGSGTTVTYGNGGTIITASGGGGSVLTTKGDLWTYSTGDVRLPVGANNYLLTPDSTQATGLRWAQSITPAQLPFSVVTDTIATDTNDYNPVGLSTAVQLRLTATGATRSITGLVISGSAGAPNLSELKITNVGTINIILRSESTSSTAANRFSFDSKDIVLLPGQNCTVWYDWTVARWRGVATSSDGKIGGQHATTGIISPSAITVSQNNYSPAGLDNAAVLRLTATAVVSITGLAGGYGGRRIVMINIGTLPITLVNQSLSSISANRFFTGTSDTTIVGNNSASLIYDDASGYWRVYAGTGGAITGAGGLIQSKWIEVFTDRVTTSINWTTYSSRINSAVVLPTGTITVLTTGVTAATPTVPGSPAANAATPTNPQTLIVQSTTNDAQIVTYTGKTGTTFTGCTGGVGAISVGNYLWNGPVQTSVAAPSDGVSLPTGTINVVSTTGFPASGILLVTTTNGTQRVTYTGGGGGGTTFTGCVGGTGTMSTGGMIYNVSAVTPHDLLTMNLTTSGGAMIIIATANASTDSHRTGYFHVLVDGFFRRGGSTQGNGGAPAGSAVVSLKLSDVPAGDHVVTFRWVVEGGTFAVRPVTRPQDNNASLLVQEVSS